MSNFTPAPNAHQAMGLRQHFLQKSMMNFSLPNVSMNGKQLRQNKNFKKEDYKTFIKDEQVAVFSVTYCPHCTDTKKTLANLDVDASVVEVNNLPDVDGTKAFLNEKTGMRTYPKTFVNGKLIGGNSELQGLVKSGKFQKMLK